MLRSVQVQQSALSYDERYGYQDRRSSGPRQSLYKGSVRTLGTWRSDYSLSGEYGLFLPGRAGVQNRGGNHADQNGLQGFLICIEEGQSEELFYYREVYCFVCFIPVFDGEITGIPFG